MRRFFRYCVNPQVFVENDRHVAKGLFKLFLLNKGLNFFIWLILGVINLYIGLPKSYFGNISAESVALSAVFLAPIFEELIFRLPLKINRTNSIVAISAVSILIVYHSISGNEWFLSILFFMGGLTLLTLGKWWNIIEDFLSRRYRLVFYISCISFGILHITNYYDLSFTTIYLIPLITLPQIISGFVLGYIRMKYGFIYGVIYHSVNNALIVLLMK